MCGRYSLINAEEKKLKKRFKVRKTPKKLKPRYNIAPSQKVAVITNESPGEIQQMRWGLIPHWAKEIDAKYSMINAKSETIFEKPAYKGPIRNKRCLVIADSFYEWKKTPRGKVPYRIKLKDGSIFAFAGVWDMWAGDDGAVYSCSIITTDSNDVVGRIHDRMPVILPAEKEKEYLDSKTEIVKIKKLLAPYGEKDMEAYEISKLVNSPANDSEEVIKPAK